MVIQNQSSSLIICLYLFTLNSNSYSFSTGSNLLIANYQFIIYYWQMVRNVLITSKLFGINK